MHKICLQVTNKINCNEAGCKKKKKWFRLVELRNFYVSSFKIGFNVHLEAELIEAVHR